MTDDLLQRLRALSSENGDIHGQCGPALREAADEIERLRATVNRVRLSQRALEQDVKSVGCVFEMVPGGGETWEVLRNARAESAERERDGSRAENARLLAELVALRERIEKAPIADTEVEYIDENTRIVWLKDEAMPDDFSGKRVRLLVEE